MKKLLCLISFALLIAACSSDSTETSTAPATPPTRPVEETVADSAQKAMEDAADKAVELKDSARQVTQETGDAVVAKAKEVEAGAQQLAQQGTEKLTALAAAAPSFEKGNSIYQQSCRNCHDAGLMGAPKLGHERFSADIEVLVENSINGVGRMPARGGNSSLSDADVRAAVEYMVDQSK